MARIVLESCTLCFWLFLCFTDVDQCVSLNIVDTQQYFSHLHLRTSRKSYDVLDEKKCRYHRPSFSKVGTLQRIRKSAQTSLFSASGSVSKLSSNDGEFCTEIFLEDTDAFGIVYNANYLTLYQRAVEQTLFPSDHGTETGNKRQARPLIAIERCEKLKYSQGAKLGDKLRIVSCLVNVVANEDGAGFDNSEVLSDKNNAQDSLLSVWEQTCTRASDGTLINSVISWVRIFSSSSSTNHGGSGNKGDYVPEMLSLATKIPYSSETNAMIGRSKPRGTRIVSDPIRVFLDECQPLYCANDGDGHQYGVGLLSALRYFERSRTLYYGGPSYLNRFSDEGCAVVVAKIDNLILHTAGSSAKEANGSAATFGDEVIVNNYVHLRGKSLVTFHHRLHLLRNYNDDKSISSPENLPLIAEASVVLACLNTTSGRATPFPEWAMERLKNP